MSARPQGDGSHLAHGSIGADLNRLRSRVSSLETEVRRRMSDCPCEALRGGPRPWIAEPCASCKVSAKVLG